MNSNFVSVVRTVCAGTLSGQLDPTDHWPAAIGPAIIPLLQCAADPNTDGLEMCKSVLELGAVYPHHPCMYHQLFATQKKGHSPQLA